jgi:hypothetical protein
LELRATGNVASGIGSLADVSAGLSVAVQRGVAFQTICDTDATPLFRCMKIRKDWLTLRRPQLQLLDDLGDDEVANAFEEIDIVPEDGDEDV